MSSRKLSKPIAIGGVSLILLAGGGYGIVNANSGSASNTATAATSKVIPFDRGNPSPAKVVGQVPQGWTAGSGNVAAGTAANKAKTAAIAAYPGGTINRVVLLSNGDYNVHIIGVNWPHHVFVNHNFEVIGAE
jgi:hypothetical protein